MKWYALFDSGLVHPLGEHQSFDEAAEAAYAKSAQMEHLPSAVWIMDAVSLRVLDASILNIKVQNL